MACSGGPIIIDKKKTSHSYSQENKDRLPINTIPFRWSNSGNFGFSDAWPHPAQTAKNEISF
jgi:hypothetical protein